MQADIHSGRGLQESSDFSCAAMPTITTACDGSTLCESDYFRGATMVNNRLVVFAPAKANCVGIFDPTDNNFSCVDISSKVSMRFAIQYGRDKFHGVTTVSDGRVVFAPSDTDCVGIFDPMDNTFNCVDISSTIRIAKKFAGATTANDGRVIFAPYDADCVGIFDPTNNTFSCVDISSTIFRPGRNAYYKFTGATTASNGLVVFAPYRGANCVGIFDPNTDFFRCVDISSTINGDYYKFSGATTVSNGLVVFAPYQVDCV